MRFKGENACAFGTMSTDLMKSFSILYKRILIQIRFRPVMGLFLRQITRPSERTDVKHYQIAIQVRYALPRTVFLVLSVYKVNTA